MHTSERITSTFQYVIDGVIRQPKTLILLSILGIGNFLIDVGQKSLVHKYCHGLQLGDPVFLPQPFLQYALYVVIIMIIVGMLLMILQSGYVVQIYRGISPAPPVRDVKALFRDGFFLSIIGLGYSIIPVLIGVWTVLLPLQQKMGEFHNISSSSEPFVISPELLQTIGIIIGGFVLSMLLYIIFCTISFVGLIRFSRTGSIRSAFEIPALLAKIGDIGWVRYLLSLLLLLFFTALFSGGIYLITLVCAIFGIITETVFPGINEIMLGIRILVSIFLDVLIVVFNARYLSLLYDAGTESVQEPAISSETREF
ncbi:DUF4013 domain-containing protein [uncultured Methanospirillum sp.]|uniref:DUF4013 domain-containing protein n=1 Tax=uncultured Methanospirillum sp. TaxID=262503 RepID=UPI0029C8E573|nr:DUF4013 domain-containing protein [uncultured Methanospirillum sp.]